ncbi:MAG: hypothetical protein AAF617_04465 [Bacteroidota bacterium]
MKKSKFKKLQLSKKSISKLAQSKIGGAEIAITCEGPCQGGTSCCAPQLPPPCITCTR